MDVRKVPPLKDLHVFTGQISKVNVPVIAVLGTDCACGKMTTAVELNKALNSQGIKSVLIATGQTSLMQGARYGISIDALVSQFVIGEIEHASEEMVKQVRMELHYAINNYFIDENQILKQCDKLTEIPAIIIHGRYDLVCPMDASMSLHKALPKAQYIVLPNAGHVAQGDEMVDALIGATNNMIDIVCE